MHESFDREDDVTVGSERGFGIVFAVVFVIIGLWPLMSEADPRWWSLIVAAFFLAAGYLFPVLLRPLNLLWFKFGLVLYKVVNPIVMGLLFFVTVAPMGLIMRLFGKDFLNRKLDPDAKSYWIHRDPPGPEPESMKNQF